MNRFTFSRYVMRVDKQRRPCCLRIYSFRSRCSKTVGACATAALYPIQRTNTRDNLFFMTMADYSDMPQDPSSPNPFSRSCLAGRLPRVSLCFSRRFMWQRLALYTPPESLSNTFFKQFSLFFNFHKNPLFYWLYRLFWLPQKSPWPKTVATGEKT